MKYILAALLLLSAGCQARGSLNAQCKEDGSCAGNLVCIHRENYDRVHGYNSHWYVCVLPSEVRQ